ncbi:MAG: dTDP-4-dehydrorhamnose 3,5-epimerase [Gammaproteobacteria bacterium]
MRFSETKLSGAYLIEPELIGDERGFFARTFCGQEFRTHGLEDQFVQCNISYNKQKYTIRGMHFQVSPHEEAKLVKCIAGAIFDVIVDLRCESPTYSQYVAEELSAGNRKMLYIPKGFAHGFQTIADDTEVFYQMSEYYVAGAGSGYRWDDPAFNITWPQVKNVVISAKDQSWPEFKRDQKQ